MNDWLAALAFAPQLDQGIFLGVVLSLGLFLYCTMSPRFVEVSRHADVSMRDAERHQLKTSNTVAIYRFDGDLYFANTGYLEGKLLNAIAHKPNLTVMVLDGENRFFRECTQAIKDAKRQWGDAIDIEPLLNYMPAEASVIKPIQAVSGAETEPNTKPLIA